MTEKVRSGAVVQPRTGRRRYAEVSRRHDPWAQPSSSLKLGAARSFPTVSAPRLRSFRSARRLAPPTAFTSPLHRRHRTTMISLGRARRIRPFLFPRAPHPRISLPPPLPPSPPPHIMQAALHSRTILYSLRTKSFPFPPKSTSRGVHSSLHLLLRHPPAFAVNLALRMVTLRVLRFSVLLSLSAY